jgi:hypothetical protein
MSPTKTFVDILHDEPRRVFHRVPLRAGARVFKAWLLKRIDLTSLTSSTHRDVLYIEDPNQLLGELPPQVRKSYDRFAAEIRAFQRSRPSATAAAKEAVRSMELHASFSDLRVVPIAYRFGVVPALIVQESSPYSIALASPIAEHRVHCEELSSNDALTILQSHAQHLSQLVHAYLEQIGFYFRAMFFNARDHDVIHYCLRIRQIASESLKDKLEFIENSRNHPDESVAEIARQAYENNFDLIQTAHLAYDVTLLLVNYVYRFYCIQDRVSEYQESIRARSDGQDIFAYGDETKAFLVQSAVNAEALKPEFLRQLARNRPIQSHDWQQVFGEAAAFIGEINNLAAGGGFDRLTGFLSYHFDVTASELFFEKLNRIVNDVPGFQLLRGRKLDESIRWSLLSLIWLADVHMLFVPNSWQRVDGTPRTFNNQRDWAMLELVYGHHLNRMRENFVATPDPLSERRQFVAQIKAYTVEREIEELPEEGWTRNCERIKRELLDGLSDTKYNPVHLGADDSNLLAVFNERIFQPALRGFVRSLAEAFSYWFDTDEGHTVRALACLSNESHSGQFTVRNVLERRIHHNDVVVVSGMRRDDDAALNKVRAHLDKAADEFAFWLGSRAIPIIRAVRTKGKANRYCVDLSGLFEQLRTKFGERVDGACQKEFLEIMCRRRRD